MNPIAKARGLSRRHLAERGEVQATAKAVSFVVWILGTHDNRPCQTGHAYLAMNMFWFPELWFIFVSKITATKFKNVECSYTVIISTIPTMTAIFVCFVVSLAIVTVSVFS